MKPSIASLAPSPVGGRYWRHAGLFLLLLVITAIRIDSCSAATEADPDWNGTTPEALADGGEYSRPDIAVGQGGLVVAAWNAGQSEGSHGIYAAFSGDGGATWSASGVISATETDSYLPDVLVAGEQVFVSWTEREGAPTYGRVLYEAEYEAGSAWSVRQIPGSESAGNSRGRLAANESYLFIVFNAGTEMNRDILYASRALTGTAWDSATVAYTHTGAADEGEPAVALSADGGTIHAVWDEVDAALHQVVHMSGTVTAGDIAWRQPVSQVPVSSTNALARPSLSVGVDGDVHVVWGSKKEEGVDVFTVEYSRYDPHAGTWLTPAVTIDTDVVVNSPTPGHPSPLVASHGAGERNDVCVTWSGFRAEENAEEIWIRCSADGGSTWGVVQNVSRTPGPVQMSIWPSMDFSSEGRLHLVWRESVAFDSYWLYHAASLYQVYLPLVARALVF